MLIPILLTFVPLSGIAGAISYTYPMLLTLCASNSVGV